MSHADSRFRQALLELLSSEPADEARVLLAVEERSRRREPVYSTLLEILTHLSFSEAEARRHWQAVSAHRRQLQHSLGRDPGLRVALLDWFANVNRELRNPKMIEIAIYESTERSAQTDGLTGLSNHAFLVQTLRREVLRARRHGGPVSLVMLDLDDFKRVNDQRGHVEGDRVLRAAAGLVREGLREIDTAARYGGEEFALLLPETSRTGAFVVAERLRATLERHFAQKRRGPRVTVSGGVACFPEDADSAEDLVRRADEALYRAKAGGKNRIVLLRGDRRRHARRPLTGAARLEADRATRARLRNVSAGGLLVALRHPLEVGAGVDVVVRAGLGRDLRLRGTVVRVAPAADGQTYEVGLSLSDPEDVAHLLGPRDARAKPEAETRTARASLVARRSRR